jgi:UDP-N-acetyl-D-glucosamine dehydrogenase
MSVKHELLERIEERKVLIGIVGLGYVGLPLGVAFAEAGFQVIGVDLDESKVNSLNAGVSYIEDIDSEVLAGLVNAGKIQASTSYSALKDADTISICVPTPLRKTKDPDISYIVKSTESIVAETNGGRGKLIVLESTTYPGTTEEIILPRLSQNGAVVGEDFFLAFSPERIDPGRTDYNVWTTPKVVGGMTPACQNIALKLYGTIVEQPVPVSSPAVAEMVKLLENTFRAVNIGMVNEMALMCDRLGLNVWEVVDAAATKPYGFMPFYPGPGLGGHCIPVDPHYLSWKLRTLNYKARFIELATEVNGAMPEYVVLKISDALNAECKSINGSRILVLGVAYKPNVSDMRESPALDVIHLLREKGGDVTFHDPHVPDLAVDGVAVPTVELTEEVLHKMDCVVIITHHNDYDWRFVIEHANVIVDTRNALDEELVKNAGNAKVFGL